MDVAESRDGRRRDCDGVALDLDKQPPRRQADPACRQSAVAPAPVVIGWSAGRELLHAPAQLVGWNVLDVGRDGPDLTKGILDRTAAISIELGHQRPAQEYPVRGYERVLEPVLNKLHIEWWS